MYTISIDVMSGDHGLNTTVAASCQSLAKIDGLQVILVGDEAAIEAKLQSLSVVDAVRKRIRIQHASEVVAMDESPAQAMRNKKDSSMRVAINLVKSGDAAGCVSAGNTGALMATARFVLKTLENVDRPAICTSLPRLDGETFMMDLGANVDSSAEMLLQFGYMGSSLAQCVSRIDNPRVGLLNIGIEDIKGNETIKQASQLFKDSKLNYVGYVEADEIFVGNQADLIVCDGFVGNVALKASEGAAKFIANSARAEYRRNIFTKLIALTSIPVLKKIQNRVDPRRYNGASLLGLRGTVVKSHGGADELSFGNAIAVTYEEVRSDLVNRIAQSMA